MSKPETIKEKRIVSVQELSPMELDYWVARAEGIDHPIAMRKMEPGFVMVPTEVSDGDSWKYTSYMAFSPTTNGAQGIAIIEREKIGLDTWQGDWGAQFSKPRYSPEEKFSPSHHRMRGPTALIAAMRTYVSSVYGPFFEVYEDGSVKVVDRPERPKFKPAKKSNED